MEIKTKNGKYQIKRSEKNIELVCLYRGKCVDTLLKTYSVNASLNDILDDLKVFDLGEA